MGEAILMLSPRFFMAPSDLRLERWQEFQVLGYARVGNWTLVRWRVIMGEPKAYRWQQGETLYQGNDPIEAGRLAGDFDLYEAPIAPEQSKTPRQPLSVFDRVDRRIGRNGIPPSIAIQLRHPRNYRSFRVLP
jgi:hypothetical protein